MTAGGHGERTGAFLVGPGEVVASSWMGLPTALQAGSLDVIAALTTRVRNSVASRISSRTGRPEAVTCTITESMCSAWSILPCGSSSSIRMSSSLSYLILISSPPAGIEGDDHPLVPFLAIHHPQDVGIADPCLCNQSASLGH